MKRVLRKLLTLIALTSVFFIACAEVDTPQYEVSLYNAMDKWMKAHRPNVPMIDSGLYYKIFDKHAAGDDLIVGPDGDTALVEVLINGKTLDGSVFLNSNAIEARKLGNFRYTTRYVPFRYIVGLYDQYTFTNDGVNHVIKKMKVGDSAVVFLSPNNSYGTIESPISQYTGFEGSVFYTNGMIGEYNIKLKKIDPSPLDTVLRHTEKYAVKELKLNAKDSIQKGLYVKRTDSIGGGEFIGEKDTTIQIKYQGYYLDGFVFDTNIEEVAREHNIYNPAKDYGTYSYSNKKTGSEDAPEVIVAWLYSIRKLKPGDKATILTIPEWGYGDDGQYNNQNGPITFFPGVTPIAFEIEIVIPED